jgi:hypothetical protein
MRTIALERQQVRAQEDRVQAEYLADSGLERAAVRLTVDAAYSGEIWQIGAESFSGRAAGIVQIHVARIPDEPQSRLLRARADFPADAPARVRRSKEIRIVLRTAGGAP